MISKSGGHVVVANWLGVKPPTVYRWTYPRDRGGTDGQIPRRYMEPWIEKAAASGISIEMAEFYTSRPIEPPSSEAA